MQSIYWVLSWACHRKCVHCYDDRFRPYVREALSEVVDEGRAAHARIIANLPDDLTWIDDRNGRRLRTRLILAGGELLIDGVREELLYPTLEALTDRYGRAAGDAGAATAPAASVTATARRDDVLPGAPPLISIQTTGDVLTPTFLDELLERGVEGIAIASIDDYHVGMQGERKFAFMERIRELMASRGVRETSLGGEKSERLKMPAPSDEDDDDGPTFLFFGAQQDLWIGELWPRGRAFQNGLTTASYETNFCARWSGAKNFLRIGQAGSEVAIEPDGSVYPCCLKTRVPLGSLAEERLVDILESVSQLPAIQALDRGDPEAMGLESGWDRETFRRRSHVEDGQGRIVANPCLGCDAFFEETLGAELRALRQRRLAAAGMAAGTPDPPRNAVPLG